MKKLLLVICFAFALGTLPAAAKASKPPKSKSEKGKKSFFHHERSNDKAREQSARSEVAAGVSPGPKSVGWRRQTPGPAGAGAY